MHPVAEAVAILRSADIQDVEQLFWDWRQTPPDLEELVSACCRAECFSESSTKLVMAAAKLASEENDNAYHNNHHFREVFAVTYMLASDGRRKGRISEKHFARRLAAALLHDYKHDGQKNTVGGVHFPFRLEQHSFAAAKDHLIAAGATQKDLLLIEAFILATDASALEGHVSPADSLKNYVDNGSDNPEDLNPRLRVLHDYNLVDTALLLHDADIATSAALSPRFNALQGQALEIEWQMTEPLNQVFFLSDLCRRRMYSRSGQELLQPGMNVVLQHFGLEAPTLPAA